MKTNFFSRLISFACLLYVAAGCGSSDTKPTMAPPVKVDVEVVGVSDAQNGSSYSGVVASGSSTTLSFAVAGTIDALLVEEGQKVSAGQLLGRLKTGDYQNANNIAKATLAEAEDAYARLKKLHDANALPDIKWVEIQQKVSQARNAVDISERALSETALHSPVSGVVNRKFADKGQNVAPIEPVYEIISLSDLTIDVSVPENEINSFHEGQEAVVSVDGIADMTCKVSRIAVVANPLTRTYTVKVNIPQTEGRIRPGMIGSVVFKSDSPKNAEDVSSAVMLPSQAVTLGSDNRTFVWLVKDGKAERRFVESDEMTANGVLVKSGLNPGDTVIVSGMQKVGTGSKVEINIVK